MRTKPVPFFSTMRAPREAPISWALPMTMPGMIIIFPMQAKAASEVRLLVAFMILV